MHCITNLFRKDINIRLTIMPEQARTFLTSNARVSTKSGTWNFSPRASGTTKQFSLTFENAAHAPKLAGTIVHRMPRH
jgi:hypothetical protein